MAFAFVGCKATDTTSLNSALLTQIASRVISNPASERPVGGSVETGWSRASRGNLRTKRLPPGGVLHVAGFQNLIESIYSYLLVYRNFEALLDRPLTLLTRLGHTLEESYEETKPL
jgi:hypothetical protein